MLVALNLLYLRPGLVGGTETYAAGLLHGLDQVAGDERFVVLLNRQCTEWTTPASPRFERLVCPVDGRRQVTRYLYEQTRLPGLLRRIRADVVHSLGYVSPLVTSCPRVVTIHDLNFIAFGSQMRPLQRIALQAFVPSSARRAQAVLAVSRFSQAEISTLAGVASERVIATPSGSPDVIRREDGLNGSEPRWRPIVGPYLIAFGSATPNKNLSRLIDAMPAGDGTPRLVIVGHLSSDVHAKAQRAGVVLTGYLDSARLQDALVGSEALVFPSIYEGFGLPVLEAMALGVPVVCSNAASIPEVGGDAVRYFDPLNVEEMRSRIVEVSGSPTLRCELRRRGLARAAGFTWRKTAERTLDVYRRVVAEARAAHA